MKFELDQQISDKKRLLNKLYYEKQKKLAILDKLKQVPNRHRNPNKADPGRRSRQIENSLDKFSSKIGAALHVKRVYKKIKYQLEKKVISFPRNLDQLEQKKLEHDIECQHMKQTQLAAIMEMESAKKELAKLEAEVTGARREREITLRKLRKRVKDMEKFFEEHHFHYPHNKQVNKVENKDSQQLVKIIQRTEELLDKNRVYENEAKLLEYVTVIPFSDLKALLDILRRQRQTTEELEKQSVSKRENLITLRQIHRQLSDELEKEMHNQKEWLDIKIHQVEQVLEQKNDELLTLKSKTTLAKQQVDDVVNCTDALLGHLVRTTDNIDVEFAELLKQAQNEVGKTVWKWWRADSDLDSKLQSFLACMNAVELVYENTDHIVEFRKESTDLSPILDPEHSLNKGKADNNIRVSSCIQRRLTETQLHPTNFDAYYGQKNDDYLSREVIKTRANDAVRSLSPKPPKQQ